MKRLLFLFLCLLVVGGCNQGDSHHVEQLPETPLSKPMISTYVDFKVCLLTNRVRSIEGEVFSSQQYVIPEEKWFVENYPNIVKEFQFKIGQGAFELESNDCDNFTKVAIVAGRMYFYQKQIAPGSLLSTGEFIYKKWTGEKHDLVCAIVRSDIGKYKVLFFEPQICKFVDLTDEERDSCSFYLF